MRVSGRGLVVGIATFVLGIGGSVAMGAVSFQETSDNATTTNTTPSTPPRPLFAQLTADTRADLVRAEPDMPAAQDVELGLSGTGTQAMFGAAGTTVYAGAGLAAGHFDSGTTMDLASPFARYCSDCSGGGTYIYGVQVLLGAGNGQFTATAGSPYTAADSGDLAAADLNADGLSDVVVAGYDGSADELLATGGGDLGAATTVPMAPSGVHLSSPHLVDVSGDGHPDLAALGSDDRVYLALGRPSGAFGTATALSMGGSTAHPGDLAIGDVNGDAKLDLVTYNGGDGQVGVRLGTGAGTFAAPVETATGLAGTDGAVATGDINGDGLADIVVADADPGDKVVALLQYASHALSAPVDVGVGHGALRLALGDADGDGKLDLVTYLNTPLSAPFSEEAWRYYRNQSTLTPPTVATSPATSVTTGAATLNASVDPKGTPTDVVFDYGPTTGYGSTTGAVHAGTGVFPAPISSAVTGLARGTTYHYRARALYGQIGVVNGADETFTTPAPPALAATTGPVSGVTTSGAHFTGTVTTAAGDGVDVHFSVHADGATLPLVTRTQHLSPTTDGDVPVDGDISGLDAGTSYTVRLVATDASDTATGDPVAFTTAAPPVGIDGAINVPFHRQLLSRESFHFSVDASVTPSSAGPLTYEWDFGDGRTFTETDRAHPEQAPFQPVAAPSASASAMDHTYQPAYDFSPRAASRDATFPSISQPLQVVQGKEVRQTTLVRVRVTDRFGDQKIVAAPVQVLPDTPPTADFSAGRDAVKFDAKVKAFYHALLLPLEYTQDASFVSHATDGDAAPKGFDVTGRDRIVSETWRFDGGPPQTFQIGDDGSSPRAVDYFDRDRGATGDVDTVAIPPLPTPATGDPNAINVGPIQQNQKNEADEESVATTLAARAAALPRGPNGSGDRTVSLTVTDRGGLSSTVQKVIPMRRRVPPAVDLTFDGMSFSSAAKLDKVLTSDAVVPGDETGTKLALGFTHTKADPAGHISAYVVQVGLPQPRPCAADSRAKGACVKATSDGLAPTSIIKTLVLPGTTGPVNLTFPEPSAPKQPWSVRIVAYDETGAVGSARYDGFEVQKANFTCREVTDGINVGDAAFTGHCVNSGTNGLYWTRKPISLDGAEIAPPPGGTVVITKCGGTSKGRLYGVAAKSEPSAGQSACGYKPKAVQSLRVLAAGSPVASIPPAEQQDLAHGGLHLLGHLPSAAYQGFDVSNDEIALLIGPYKSGKPLTPGIEQRVALDRYGSRLHFTTDMPQVFATPSGTVPQATTDITGFTQGHDVVVKRFDGLAEASRARRAHLRQASRTALDPTLKTPSTLDLGDLPIGVNGAFRYDPQTHEFDANVVIPVFGETAHGELHLKDGKFVAAEASYDGPIAVGAATIDGIDLAIDDTPKLRAAVHLVDTASNGHLLDANGALTQSFSPFSTQLDVNATLLSTIDASAHIGLAAGGLTFTGSLGKDFGPASLQVDVSGAFGQHGFDVEGDGEACLSIACLGISGVVSDVGVGACGSVKLLFAELKAGFGYRFADPGSGFRAFVGSCDFAPFRDPNAATRALGPTTPVVAMHRPVFTKSGTPVIVPEPSVVQAVDVRDSSFDVPLPGYRGLAAVVQGRDVGPLSTTPAIQLTAPDGKTYTSSPIIGGQSVSGDHRVLFDQDIVTGQTRVLIGPGEGAPKPEVAQKTWSIHVLDGSEPVSSITWSLSLPPVDKTMFFAPTNVTDPSNGALGKYLEQRRSALLAGSLTTLSGLSTKRLTLAEKRGAAQVVTQGDGGKETIDYGNVPVSSVSGALAEELRRLRVNAWLPPGESMTLVDNCANCQSGSPDGHAAQQLAVIHEPITGDGTVSATLDFLPRLTGLGYGVDKVGRPAPTKHWISAFITGSDGVGRGVVDHLIDFSTEGRGYHPPVGMQIKRTVHLGRPALMVDVRGQTPMRGSDEKFWEVDGLVHGGTDFGWEMSPSMLQTLKPSLLDNVEVGGIEPTQRFYVDSVARSSAVTLRIRGVGPYENQALTAHLAADAAKAAAGNVGAVVAGR